MCTCTYVFLVDVDRDAAIKAYEKGLADLQGIWPELEAYCKVQDQKEKEHHEACARERREEKRAELAGIRQVKLTAKRALPKAKWWHFTKYEEVPLPVSPITDEDLDEYLMRTWWRMPSAPSYMFSTTAHYDSMLHRLDERIAHVKMSSLPTLRMEENDARVMREWGDGTHIAQLKEMLKNHAEKHHG